MLGSDNDHILCSRLMIDVQNLMCRNNHWFLLRTYVVYFLINLVSAEMGEEARQSRQWFQTFVYHSNSWVSFHVWLLRYMNLYGRSPGSYILEFGTYGINSMHPKTRKILQLVFETGITWNSSLMAPYNCIWLLWFLFMFFSWSWR